jgi:hypothetical protein
MKQFTIVPSITTHSTHSSTWREKIAEILSLQVREVGLFLTGLTEKERIECYRLLLTVREAHDFSIPFVHAVSTMTDSEYSFLRFEFGTRWFNLHSCREFPLLHPLSAETRRFITIENTTSEQPLCEEDLEGFAGLCIDLSHLEDARLMRPEVYYGLLELCSHYPVFANHISAVSVPARQFADGVPQHSCHYLQASHEVHYLRASPPTAFGEVAALELENSLLEQVRLVQEIKALLFGTSFSPHDAAA